MAAILDGDETIEGSAEYAPAAVTGVRSRRRRLESRAASSADERIENVLLVGLVAGLAWAPFWLGGNRMTPWGVDAIAFPGLTLIYEVSLFLRGRSHPFAARWILASIVLFLSVALWALAQASPLASMAFAHPIWGMASDALATTLPATISVDPPATMRALMRLLTEASVCWLAIQLCRDPPRGLFLLQAIAAIVAAYCAYGLILAVVDGAAIPLFDAPAGGPVRSTFVNRNSFATYAGLGLTVVVALTLRLYRRAIPDATGATSFRLSAFIAATGGRGGALIGGGLLILVALLGTLSRGGILSTAVAVFAVLALTATQRSRKRGERVEAIVFIAVAVVVAFVFFGDRFVGRIAESGLADASRVAVYTITLRAIFDAPLLGFGYGTFADVFPMYRDQSIPPFETWELAHNSYLEVWLGLGLLFGTALMAAIGLLALRCLTGAVRRRRDAIAPVVAAAATLLVGAHALVDFSLQMQAVTLTFAALLGVGVAQSESSRHAVSD